MATGGTLSLVPATTLVALGVKVAAVPITVTSSNNGRNVRQKVANCNDGMALGIVGSNMGSLLLIVEMMNNQTRTFMRQSFRDVHNDYQLAKSALANAKAENDDASISFYQVSCCNLEEELRSFEENN